MLPEISEQSLNGLETLVDTGGDYPQPLSAVGLTELPLIAGRYRLIHLLGEGGMGNVYLADDLVLARQVAVKTVRPELSGNEEVRARIKRECRMHAAIGTHPHIITLYDTVEVEGRICLVLEYFAGQTLAQLLAAGGSTGLTLETALSIIRQLLQALSCIHEREIVHRDIKTSNILLQPRGNDRYLVKLTDFGIARGEDERENGLTRLTGLGGQGPGTPVYMAPERIDPQTFGAICPATDLYAVGIMLYELLTGAPPFKGTMTEIFSGHLMQSPSFDVLPGGIPAQVRHVLRKALAKQPTDRYPDTESMLVDLAAIPEDAAVLPHHDGGQDATLLVADIHAEPPVAGDATLLLTAPFPRETTILHGRYKWFYLALVLIIFLGTGAIILSRFLHKPEARTNNVPPVAVQAPAVEPEAVAVSQSVPAPEKKDSVSALEAVEQVRQGEAESMTTKSEGAGQEWRVIETKSRKIR